MAASPQSSRFSLLLLEDGEHYLQDYACFAYDGEVLSAKNRARGRLRVCTKSVVFEPEDDPTRPLLKLSFSKLLGVGRYRGRVPPDFADGGEVFVLQTTLSTLMMASGVVEPYRFVKAKDEYKFSLRFESIVNFLPMLQDLLEISNLDSMAEQEKRVAKLLAARNASFPFDPTWIRDFSERTVFEADAARLTPLVHNPGRVVLTTAHLFFQPFNNVSPQPYEMYARATIEQVERRRHLLRDIGLEVFLRDGAVLYLSFDAQRPRDELHGHLIAQPGVGSHHGEANMTLKWQNGLVSNFDYLTWLNSRAHRTVNDLTQYPVFPWVLADYTSPVLDLSSPASYRDLSKPIGALTPARLASTLERYREMPPGRDKFMYGTHYSTPGYVLFYLVRSRPELMLKLQNGKFDAPDRMFDSIAATWANCLLSASDVKELIPEFYSGNGEWLRNTRSVPLGIKQSGEHVRDVLLPPWATSPEDFVNKCRAALESDHVSAHLHEWIDLIFGAKQRGAEAERANNVFFYLTYEGAVDIEAISDARERYAIELQISEFGQTPRQLFTAPHPQRKPRSEYLSAESVAAASAPTAAAAAAATAGPGPSAGVGAAATAAAATTAPPVASTNWLGGGRRLQRRHQYRPHREAVTGVALDPAARHLYSVSLDFFLKSYAIGADEPRQVRSNNLCSLGLSCAVAAPGEDGLIIVGAFSDHVYVYSSEFGSIAETLSAHHASVSAVAMAGDLLVSVSWDSSVRVWQRKGRRFTPTLDLQEHNVEVKAAAISSDQAWVVSGDAAGALLLWSVGDGSLERELDSGGEALTALAFTPDSRRIVAASADGALRVLELRGGTVFETAVGEAVHCVLTDGRVLLAGTESGRLRGWELESGSEMALGADAVMSSAVRSATVAVDGSVIACGCEDGSVYLLDIVA